MSSFSFSGVCYKVAKEGGYMTLYENVIWLAMLKSRFKPQDLQAFFVHKLLQNICENKKNGTQTGTCTS